MPSLSDILRIAAARNPDRTALIFGDRRTTYSELAVLVEKMASVLADRGVRHGDRVLLLSGNSDSFVVAAYAVLRTGAILVPANPRSAPPELAYLLADSGASALIVAAELAGLARAGTADSSATTYSLGRAAGFADLIELTASTDLASLERWPAESDDSLIIYTSGTTGRPKGALFDHHRSVWVGINVSAAWGMREEERMLHVAPLYHAAELCLMLFPGFMAAATHIILAAFDPALVAHTIAEQGVTVFFGVPTMYQFLLQVPQLFELDLSGWRVGMFGAAPMPASLATRLIDSLPSVLFYQLCGQTEAGPGGVYSGPEDVRRRPQASGRYPLPNTEWRIVNTSGRDVQANEAGELLLRSETIMKSYWGKPDETASAMNGEWLRTGDVATFDADGYMTLVDRLKDMIITGGRKVYSIEVENALMGHPDIVDVAVLGVPHPDYGESILAVIVPLEGAHPTIDEVRTWSLAQLSDYKIPHRLIVHPIPRNLSGKVQKHVLRAALEARSVLTGVISTQAP